MNNQQQAAMQMALGAMLTAQNTLIFKCGGDMRPMERETLDDLVEAITLVQLALAAKTRGNKMGSSVDPTPTYFVGHPDGTYSVADPQPSVNQPTAHKSLSLDDVLFAGASNEIAEALAQPQGEWVDLTDDEIQDVFVNTESGFVSVIHAVIAKFKEKNTPPVVPQGEPVGWCVHPFDYGVGHAGIYAMTQRPEQVEAWKRKGWEVKPLYTTPPSVEAAHSFNENCECAVCMNHSTDTAKAVACAIEATKEKAAKVCEKFSEEREFDVGYVCRALAAAIRSMK